MESPSELSLAEIRKYMLENGCKVTNHALVKHFKRFLTNPNTQNEARKQFKTYVNILATIKNEDNQKYLILRKKYLNECPTEDAVQRTDVPSSPGGVSLVTEGLAFNSPFRQPPPYKPPPEVSSPSPVKLPILQSESAENYRECINEFAAAVRLIDSSSTRPSEKVAPPEDNSKEESVEAIATQKSVKSLSESSSKISRENSINSIDSENKENVARFSFSSGTSSMESGEKIASDAENQISVKEATKKFNRMASEEEAKIISPPSKKKPEKVLEEKMTPEVTLSHPKAKEWVVAAAKADYHELMKLASEYPELVKLQDPTTGYTALHWAAKQGNQDVVKLIAGTYKADVNARTNGGYTPLHLAVQFGREDVFELLCNVYKANRDLMDWSGNKPLDYLKQSTSVSASTYSKIKARRKHTEKDLGFLRIGSLNVRVKKTTEAFSNFLGVGNGNGNTNNNVTVPASRQHHPHHRHHPHAGTTAANPMMRTMTPLGMSTQLGSRASVPINMTNRYDTIHKTWGSADNIPRSGGNDGKEMPPPKGSDSLKNRHSKQDNIGDDDKASSGYSSMPTTPNQLRAPIGILAGQAVNMGDSDSDLACGFGSNWSVGRSTLSLSSSNAPAPRYL